MNVVSFYAPRTEHPFFQDYRPFLALLRESCERFGHRHIVLTDDADAVGGDDAYVVPGMPRSLMKAFVWAQSQYLADPLFANEPTLLTGADCVLATDPKCFMSAGSDMVITTGDFADCRMNCGAIYIPRPADVKHIWAEAYVYLCATGDDWGDDQRAIYRSVLRAQAGDFPEGKPLRVTELPVDPYNLAPEHPDDDCRRGVVLHFRGPRKAWMVDYCHKWLDIGKGIELTVRPNTTSDNMLANVEANAGRSLPVIDGVEEHGGHAVLVGGGASLVSTLHEIKWRASQGQTIFALNGCGRFLIENGVQPHFGVMLDPRAQNIMFLDGGPRKWLLASQVHPSIFDEAETRGLKVQMWHFADSGKASKSGALIGGGITVGLTAMALVYTLGYRKLHLYGYDSSDADGAGHAYEQNQSEPDMRRFTVFHGKRWFRTAPAMYAQAKAFPEWCGTLSEGGALITVHGDGLLPSIAHEIGGPVQGDMAA